MTGPAGIFLGVRDGYAGVSRSRPKGLITLQQAGIIDKLSQFTSADV
jgi:hypothetical protein